MAEGFRQVAPLVAAFSDLKRRYFVIGKYVMTPFAQAARERLHRHTHDVEIVEDVTIRLEPHDCADFFGDELALWCHRHGLHARRMDRSRRDVVRFGFDDAAAATQFRKACGI